jgi:WD40 repeat protein
MKRSVNNSSGESTKLKDISTCCRSCDIKEQHLIAVAVSQAQDRVALACRNHVQIHRIDPFRGIVAEYNQLLQLSSKPMDNNFTVTDVAWSVVDDEYLAASGTNGVVVVFNTQTGTRKKVSNETNSRAVHRVAWHSFYNNLLASANQDATIKLYDRRLDGNCNLINTFTSRADACRDVQFSPHNPNFIAGTF